MQIFIEYANEVQGEIEVMKYNKVFERVNTNT